MALMALKTSWLPQQRAPAARESSSSREQQSAVERSMHTRHGFLADSATSWCKAFSSSLLYRLHCFRLLSLTCQFLLI